MECDLRLERPWKTFLDHLEGARLPGSTEGWHDWNSSVGWPTCSEDECQGIRLHTGGKCLAHAASHDLDVELQRLSQEGTIDARGVTISAELVDRILRAAPPDEEQTDRPRLTRAIFTGAGFGDGVSFRGATFGDTVSFADATFGDGVSFEGTTFGHAVLFARASFGDAVSFKGATFGDAVLFDGASFGGGVLFDGASFGDAVMFNGTTFDDDVLFNGASFGDDVSFDYATFGDDVSFQRVKFGGSVSFDDMKIGDWAHFGPVVAKELSLRRVTFGRSPDLVISADRVRCQQAKFSDGARLRIRWAEIALDNADFGRPSVLEVAPASEAFTEIGEPELIEAALTGTQPYRTAQPRPVCLAGCDVHILLLVDCDLRACRFAGAHNLAALRLEGTITLPTTPSGWWAAGTLPVLWHWGRRQTIAEEHYWRQRQARPQGWRGAPTPSPSPYVAEWHDRGERGDPSNPYGPAEIASVYRALRKGREDNKDEPGAADFYYGEMEMRRLASATPWGERVILWLYWLVSGYGLRGLRALAWLAAVVVGMASLLQAIGFNGGDPGFRDALIYAAQSTISIASGNTALTEHVSWSGEVLRIVLRLAGPVLLGLALLAVRNRVKR
jgi:hypothetical protein